MQFRDREDAGKKLAEKLASYKGKDVIVYAIPRGGVVVGAAIAKALDAPLDLVIVRKVGHPDNPEYAVCVVTDNEEMLCNEEERALINPETLQSLIDQERKEARRRRDVYLHGRKSLSCEGKIVILVDDGVATGLTFRVALRELKRQKPQALIAALPVVPQDAAAIIQKEGATLIAFMIPDTFLGAVGSYYERFEQVTDEDVIQLMNED